jgi:hypothetical protein
VSTNAAGVITDWFVLASAGDNIWGDPAASITGAELRQITTILEPSRSLDVGQITHCGDGDTDGGCSRNDSLSFDVGLVRGNPGTWSAQPVGAVPVPAAIWLFGTALIGLVGFGKRKSKVAV